MYQEQAFIIIRLLILVDALCIIFAGYGAYQLRNILGTQPWVMESKIFALSVLIVMVVNNYAANKLGLYSDEKLKSHLNMIWRIIKALVFDFIILSGVIFAIKEKAYSRAFMLYFAVLSFLFLVSSRWIIYTFTNGRNGSRFGTKNVLIVGERERAQIVLKAVENQLSWGHKIVRPEFLQQSSSTSSGQDCILPTRSINALPEILLEQEVDEVIFAVGGDESVDLKKYISIARNMGIETRILPALWDLGSNRIRVEEFQGIPFLAIQVNNLNAVGMVYKRLLDLVGGLVGTLIFLIMYPFVAIAIKLDSPGPVFFKQKRVGKNGRVFSLFKFRSMYADAEERKNELMVDNEMNGLMFKVEDDPRVTRAGRFIRKTSIDEFPQFINVLKGEMSLVGTRPPTMEEVAQYEYSHRKRLSAKPGITGLWQISGRNKIKDFEKVVELDCSYLESWRFWDDIKILFKTVFVVLRRKGAF